MIQLLTQYMQAFISTSSTKGNCVIRIAKFVEVHSVGSVKLRSALIVWVIEML
jgi:hypothetical protein